MLFKLLITLWQSNYNGAMKYKLKVSTKQNTDHQLSQGSVDNKQVPQSKITLAKFFDVAIKYNFDVVQLQADIDALMQWSKLWLLSFNISKCKHLRVGSDSRSAICFIYP